MDLLGSATRSPEEVLKKEKTTGTRAERRRLRGRLVREGNDDGNYAREEQGKIQRDPPSERQALNLMKTSKANYPVVPECARVSAVMGEGHRWQCLPKSHP